MPLMTSSGVLASVNHAIEATRTALQSAKVEPDSDLRLTLERALYELEAAADMLDGTEGSPQARVLR